MSNSRKLLIMSTIITNN